MPAFQIDIYPSKLFIRMLIALHSLVIFAIWLTNFPIYLTFIFTILVCLNLFWSVKKIKLSSKTIKYAEGIWKLIEYGNSEVQEQEVQPVGEAVIHRWIIIVNFELKQITHKNKQQRILVFPDSTDEESFRRLRVALQFSK